jgi:two-component system nitrogen regulation response regulator GlnG/two-component system response regulator HydG
VDDATKSTPSLALGVSFAQCEREALHLVIAWSSDEPHRIGEAAPIEGRCLLGRGPAQPEDLLPRAVFSEMRPGLTLTGAPLGGETLSRSQIELTPLPDGTLEVRSVGRGPLVLRGRAVEPRIVRQGGTVIARPGDTMMLSAALMLLVVRRRCGLPPLRAYRDGPIFSFPFGQADPHGIVGESPAAWALRDQLAFAAASGNHVLLLGESGSGKELAAKAIHKLSDVDGPFVARNASTLPDSLIDAELFGSARGYPNIGSPERPGLLGQANGGTLFLDEIGEMPPQLQAHLLRVLDRGGEYHRLGDPRALRAHFLMIAATNRSPADLKHDFCARFSTRVEMPSFELRREDIPLLLRHLLAEVARARPSIAAPFLARRAGRVAEVSVSPHLIDALLRHRYTTHTRELENLMWVALSSSLGDTLTLTPRSPPCSSSTSRRRSPTPARPARPAAPARPARPAATARPARPAATASRRPSAPPVRPRRRPSTPPVRPRRRPSASSVRSRSAARRSWPRCPPRAAASRKRRAGSG